MEYINNQYDLLINKIKKYSNMYKGSKYLLGVKDCDIEYLYLRTGNSLRTNYTLQQVLSDENSFKIIILMIMGDAPYDYDTLIKRWNKLYPKYKDNPIINQAEKLIKQLIKLNYDIQDFYQESEIKVVIDNDEVTLFLGLNTKKIKKGKFPDELDNLCLEIKRFVQSLTVKLNATVEYQYDEIDKFIKDNNLEQFIKEINQGMQ